MAILNGSDADAIIIGAGPSGIAMVHSLKHKIGFNNFTVSEWPQGVANSADST